MKIGKIIFEYLYSLIMIVGVGFAFWYYKKDDTISIVTFFLFVFPLSLLCLMLIQKIFNHRDSRKVIFPKLQAIFGDKYIFEESNLFSHNSLVSFYLVEDAEQYLGYGFIETITQKNTLQVVCIELRDGIDSKYLHENKKRIILKPSVPADLIKNKE